MFCTSAGKIDICFYYYCPADRSSKRIGWLRAFLIGAIAQGRRFGSAGALGCAAPVPGKLVKENQGECPGRSLIRSCSSAENFIQELQAEQLPRGPRAGAGKLQPCFS
jgi:hypothetical protein